MMVLYHVIQWNPQGCYSFFSKNGQGDLKIHMKWKGPGIDKIILKKKSKVGGVTIPDFMKLL
jgi:hypothetical protein